MSNSTNIIIAIFAKLNDTNETLIQATRYGNDDTVEFKEGTPFGIGGNPPKGTPLISTKTDRGSYVIGAITVKERLEPGETIHFAMDSEGKKIVSHVKTKNDGTVHVNGDDDNAVLYSKLADFANDIQGKLNSLVQQFNTLLSSANVSGIPVASTATPAQPSNVQITPAKSKKVLLS